jgi:ATP-dependent exoDNAse (exonuclease V) alpha subunit
MRKGLERNINHYSHNKGTEIMNNGELSNIDILLIKSEILLASDGKCAIDTETVYKLFEMFKQAQASAQTN